MLINLGLPELFFEWFDFRVDPTWHEFESVEYTNENRSLETQLQSLLKH